MKRMTMLVAGVIAVALALASTITGGSGASARPELVAGAAHGLIKPHGAAKASGGTRTPNMTYHGGAVMTQAVTQAIFWGTSWGTDTSDKITGIDSLYRGLGGSNYARTNTEYTNSSGTHVGTAVTYNGHLNDPSAASGGGSTSAILAEVQRVITNPDPSGNGYYPVYTDVPRGSAGYCAWHSSGTINGIRVQFGFFWKLDGDAGCDQPGAGGTRQRQWARVQRDDDRPGQSGRVVRRFRSGERRQVRLDLRRTNGDPPQQHAVEDSGRMEQCGLHRRLWLPELSRAERLSRRPLRARRRCAVSAGS